MKKLLIIIIISLSSFFLNSCGKRDYPDFNKGDMVNVAFTKTAGKENLKGTWVAESKNTITFRVNSNRIVSINKTKVIAVEGLVTDQ